MMALAGVELETLKIKKTPIPGEDLAYKIIITVISDSAIFNLPKIISLVSFGLVHFTHG